MKTINTTLSLIDSIKFKLNESDLNALLTQARMTEHDLDTLTQDLEDIDESKLVDYILENFSELTKADIKGLQAACFGMLDANEKHEMMREYIDSLWSKSTKDKHLMLELHEMLESELDTQAPMRDKIYDLTDTLESTLDELNNENPDIEWIKEQIQKTLDKCGRNE
jgi:hypothetical protein